MSVNAGRLRLQAMINILAASLAAYHWLETPKELSILPGTKFNLGSSIWPRSCRPEHTVNNPVGASESGGDMFSGRGRGLRRVDRQSPSLDANGGRVKSGRFTAPLSSSFPRKWAAVAPALRRRCPHARNVGERSAMPRSARRLRRGPREPGELPPLTQP